MKKMYLMILCFIMLISVCGCSNENFKGKKFMREGSSIQYEDRLGNPIRIQSHEDYIQREQNGDLIRERIDWIEEYDFITNSVVKYKYIKDGMNVKNYNCEYNLEENIITIKCNNDIIVFSYSKEKNCITDDNEIEYCVK